MRRPLILAAVTAGSLMGLAPAAHADLRVSSNFRLNSDSNAFRAKDQVGLAVDPRNPNHFVEINANYLNQECEATSSTDGGQTWSPATPLTVPPPAPPPAPSQQPFQPTCFVGSHLAENTFQSVKFGSGQNVYAVFAPARASPTNASGIEGRSVVVAKSTNGGQTWGTGVIAMAGGPSDTLGPYYELPTLAVDPAVPGGLAADRVYVVAHEETAAGGTAGDVATVVSNNGGTTFSAVVNADPDPENATEPSQPVINGDHSVSVAWRMVGAPTGNPPVTNPTGVVHFARSTTAGATWGAPVTVTQVVNQGRSGSNHLSPAPSSASTFPRLAVDPTNGASGRYYIVYNQNGPPTGPGPSCPSPTPFPACYTGADHFISPDTDVYFQRSSDFGATWSAPKAINDVAAKPGVPVTQTRHPDVSVAPNGRVDIVWQDRRHWFMGPTGPGITETEHDCIHTHVNCDEARLGDTYFAFSTDGGTNFSPTGGKRISDRSHNNDVGFDYRFGTGWAFGPQAVEAGNSNLLIGWMDAREGSFDNDNQDIYLAKVDLNASGTVPQASFAGASDAPGFSVNLSHEAYPGGAESTLAATFATKNSTKPVIVNEGSVPQVLAGSVLARANLGPVLLSSACNLSASVKAEVARLNPAGAYVIGDTNFLSTQVVSDLTSSGVPGGAITRVDAGGGGSDAAVAKAIADAMDRRTPAEKAANTPAFDAAVIVNPSSPDASAAAGLAAARRLPILFTDPTGTSLPRETTAALANGDLAIDKTLVIGGGGVVSDTVKNALPNATRLDGANQYETSKAVVNESKARGLPDNIVHVADGANPMSGALVGAAVGRMTGLELLAPAPFATSVPTALGDLGLSGSVDRAILVPAVPGPAGGSCGLPTTSGLTASGSNAAADKTPPSVSNFGLTNNPFVVGGRTPTFGTAAAKKKRHKKGTTFRYTLSEAATARIAITQNRAGRRKGRRCVAPTRKLRRARKCTRTSFKGTLTRVSHVGRNSVAFSGRIGSKRLSPGTYRATLTATDAAKNTSKPKTISFTIVKR